MAASRLVVAPLESRSNMAEITYSTPNPNYGVTDYQLILLDEQAVESEIENCLGISVGEHWFEPTFGADLRRYLMEPIDEITAADIWMEVLDRIAIWMPHIQMQRGTGVQPDPDNTAFLIVINYVINKTGVSGQFSRVISR